MARSRIMSEVFWKVKKAMKMAIAIWTCDVSKPTH